MILVALLILVVILAFFPTLRCAFFHPFALIWYGAKDLYYYFRRLRFNLCGSGELVAYTGLFGKGKTLSAVHKVVSSYRRYDGKKVWCSRRRKIVTQRIKVISNVSLSIPYEDFISLEQIVLAAENNRAYDDEHDTLTVTLVLGDEFSVQMNSRNFKTNIDPLFLNTILTCRHYYISLYYTAQRFGHVDALLRQVTSYVIDCDKLWRFQRLNPATDKDSYGQSLYEFLLCTTLYGRTPDSPVIFPGRFMEVEETVLFSDNFGKFEGAVYRICHRYERKHVGSVLRGEAGRSEERSDVGIRPKNGLPRQFENWRAMTEP